MVAQHSTRAVLALFPYHSNSYHLHFSTHLRETSAVAEIEHPLFTIEEKLYAMIKRNVLQLVHKKCNSGVPVPKECCTGDKQDMTITQLQRKLRRKIFMDLSFMMSDLYYAAFLNAYIDVKCVNVPYLMYESNDKHPVFL